MSLSADRMAIPGSAEIVEYGRRLGWRRAVARGAYVAANRVATLSIFDCYHMGPEHVNRALIEAGDDFECRFLAPHEAHHFASQLDGSLARLLPQAMAAGDAAYVILEGDRLASIGLYAAGPTPLLNDLMVYFEAPARYMYRGYTQARYRGLRLHAAGILRAAQELFAQGVPQLVTVCERTNYPATVSVLRMGWQPCGAVYRVGIGPWTKLGRTELTRGIGMELHVRRGDA